MVYEGFEMRVRSFPGARFLRRRLRLPRTRRRRGSNKGTPAAAEANDGPIRTQIRPKMVDLVPNTGIAANVRRVPAEYGCYGGLRPAPVGSGRLEGTNEGTAR
jgi:hypothetical protein